MLVKQAKGRIENIFVTNYSRIVVGEFYHVIICIFIGVGISCYQTFRESPTLLVGEKSWQMINIPRNQDLPAADWGLIDRLKAAAAGIISGKKA